MRTLNISISDLDYNKFGLQKDKLSFSEFVELVSHELSKQPVNTKDLAEKFGLSKKIMEEIILEVKSTLQSE